MRSYEEYQAILTLWEKGYNKSYISRRLDISRGTVSDAINRYKDLDGLNANINARLSTPDYLFDNLNENSDARQQYAYLLGLYLGDGCINMAKNGRSYFLRIALDKKYPVIIERCEQAMGTVFFNNSINRVDTPGCYHVKCYNKHLPVIFPQDCDGPKHDREIKLEDWQQAIVEEFTLDFFTGLYHSDGSRSQNIVKGKDYPRYSFTNKSEDIIDLFTWACDRLSICWTRKRRPSGTQDIFISRRPDVERLDAIVGAKA